jgi:hypothetical protein
LFVVQFLAVVDAGCRNALAVNVILARHAAQE